MQDADKAVVMKMANKLYVKQDSKILDTYKKLLKKSYKSGIEEITMDEAGGRIINTFARDTTKGCIKDAFPSGSLLCAYLHILWLLVLSYYVMKLFCCDHYFFRCPE